jgi:hypothetical protein
MNITLKAIIASGAIVSVQSVNGGWSTVAEQVPSGPDAGTFGKPMKVRNSTLRDLTEVEMAIQNAPAPKPGKKPNRAAASAARKTETQAKEQLRKLLNPGKPAKAEKPVKAPKVTKPAKTRRDPVSARPESDDVLNPDGSAFVASDKLVKPDYDRYTKHEIKSPSGRKALDVNDEAANLLRGQDIADCYFITAKNIAKTSGENPEDVEAALKEKYKNLNVGMQRMNLGNRLRKALGTYGNRNAHKGERSTDTGDGASAPKYGKRAGEQLKRASDPAQPAA